MSCPVTYSRSASRPPAPARRPCRRRPAAPPGLVFLLPVVLQLAGLATPAGAVWENGNGSPIFEPQSDALDPAVCPDGQGGMFVAVTNQDPLADRIALSHVDHTGNETWGDGGIWLPLEMGANWQSEPLDVAPDGNGGVYCAYREGRPDRWLITLSHVDAQGTQLWRQPVDDLGIPPTWTWPDVRLEATGDGEVIVGWSMYVPGHRLHAARFAATGSMSWNADINQFFENDYDMGGSQVSSWDMDSDGSGGVVVSWLRARYDINQEQVGAQRISAAGVPLWGADGHTLFAATQIDHHEALATGDGAGGAYVVSSLAGQAWAYHVEPNGIETWPAGGIMIQDTQTGNFALSTQPAICADGFGGLFLVHGFEALLAQHVDLLGNLLWGSNGIVAADRAGFQETACIANDGFGGAVIGYQDHFWGSPGQDYHVMGGLRLDVFGNKIWDNPDLYWPDWGVTEPRNVQVVADGSGGAQFVWQERDLSAGTSDIYAMGVNATGAAPDPVLFYMYPESGAPGEVVPVLILGDYLEATHTYSLQRPGSPVIPLTGPAFISFQGITGDLDLAGADLGAWDLAVDVAGTPVDTLLDAFGVGEAPGCQPDHQAFPSGPDTPTLSDSPRSAAYDSHGNLHVIWVEYGGGAYYLKYARGGSSGWSIPPTVLHSTSRATLSSCLALGPDDSQHIALITQEAIGHHQLVYLKLSPEGSLQVVDSLDDGQAKWRPTMVVDASGSAQIVYEEGPAGATELFHVSHDGVAWSPVQNIAAGTNARTPDLAASGPSSLMLTFVRDSWFPGLTEVCYQSAAGGAWDPPVMMSFGISLWSPSVAADGNGEVLFSFMLDNGPPSSPAPLLYTALMESEQLGPVRWHLNDDAVDRCAVMAAGPGLFYLLTEDGSTGGTIELRAGDGGVFFPLRQVNSAGDGHRAAFAVDRGGAGLFAFWEYWGAPGTPLYMWECYEGGVGVAGQDAPAVTGGLRAYPNPFNPATTLSISLPAAGWTRLTIYDATGRQVRALVDGRRAAGLHEVVWDGRDGNGVALPSGVYFSRLTLPGGGGVEVTKLTLLK